MVAYAPSIPSRGLLARYYAVQSDKTIVMGRMHVILLRQFG
ncbi:hypothetical protein RN629_16290 [Sphingomonadaceae bacterium jetA1]|jgi:hypothetical protein